MFRHTAGPYVTITAMQRLVVLACVLGACSGRDSEADTPAPAKHIAVAPPPKPVVKPIAPPGKRLPHDITPVAYELRLEVDPDTDAFTGSVKIHAHAAGATDRVWVHADDLEITAATFDDGALTKLAIAGDRMIGYSFGHVVAPRDITLAFTFAGH